jgi:thymidylate synthase (FAD)
LRVKLISVTDNPVDIMWTAARTCYSEKSPIDIWDNRYDSILANDDKLAEKVTDKQAKMWKLIEEVLSSGHYSIAEYCNFVFAIEGVDRALTHQLCRHRTGVVFSQKSQRYVEIKESFDTISELFENPKTDKDEDYLYSVADKYFVGVTKDNYRLYIQPLLSYLHGIKLGMKPEEARAFLPNATKTDLVMGINLRELIHVSSLRLCKRAQTPIRSLFKLIKQEVMNYDERFGNLLQPKCELVGYCTEHKTCKRKPTKQEVIDGYYKYKGLE